MYTGQGLEVYFIVKNGKLQLFLRRRGHFAAWRAISTRHQHADDRLNVIHVAHGSFQRLWLGFGLQPAFQESPVALPSAHMLVLAILGLLWGQGSALGSGLNTVRLRCVCGKTPGLYLPKSLLVDQSGNVL